MVMALPHTCNAITAPRLYRYRAAVTLCPACGNTLLSEVCSWKTPTDFIITDVRVRMPPTESTDFTETYSYKNSHRFHRSSQMLGCVCLPQNPQISQNLIAIKTPTESTEFTEVYGYKNSHRFHRIHRTFCYKYLCKSVKSVGEYLSKKVLCVLWNLWENLSAKSKFCGRTYHQKEIYFLMLWSLRYCVGDMPRWLFVNLPKNERLGKPSSSDISLIERLERRKYFSIAFTV